MIKTILLKHLVISAFFIYLNNLKDSWFFYEVDIIL